MHTGISAPALMHMHLITYTQLRIVCISKEGVMPKGHSETKVPALMALEPLPPALAGREGGRFAVLGGAALQHPPWRQEVGAAAV